MIHDLSARLTPVLDAARSNAPDVDQQARFPSEAIDELRRVGLLGITIPTRLGGLGGDASDAAAAISTLAENCASAAMIWTMHIAATAVLLSDAERFAGELTASAAGDHLGTLALSERATRSNFWVSMGSCARRPEGWRLEVEKSFVTSAGPANSYVVSAATPGRASSDDTELFLVHADEPGVEVLDWWQGSGLRGNSSAPMRFACELSDSAHIGTPASGRAILLEVMIPWFQLGAAAVSVGLCRAAARFTREHLGGSVLEHLGQRLIDQPVVRHNLGRLTADVDAADGFVRSVAAAMTAGTASITQVLELKALANEAALTATDRAMRLGGGAAYSGRTVMDRVFRDARAGVVMAPTADMLYDMIGRVAAGLDPL